MASVEPTILDNVDFDAVAVVTGTGRGVPQNIMRTTDEVAQLRQARQKAKEEQEAAQQQQAMQQTILEKGGDALAQSMGGQLGTEVMQ
jgi:hypothetical protein